MTNEFEIKMQNAVDEMKSMIKAADETERMMLRLSRSDAERDKYSHMVGAYRLAFRDALSILEDYFEDLEAVNFED